MIEPAIISSLVRRHLKEVSGFVLAGADRVAPVHVELADGVVMIGWYLNPAPYERTSVLFDTRSIWVCDNGALVGIPWDEIVGYELPKNKVTADGVMVLTSDGSCFVRMTGSHGTHGKFKDAFALVRLLHALTYSNLP